ncbi:Splicing factor [Tulasnella sp. JGI-2019a]|nr:Splicing factor [Tulasnella sp. JGI-2019a]KAG8994290.1 Splicing factor [Tulasnella sp. JGI-2019a]KAG9026777.1 Splicing factor [Tulasnella sp. JGI-2019a]
MEVDEETPVLQALEAISGVITQLAEKPMSYRLHYQSIALARCTGMEEELETARRTLTTYLAASDNVWEPLLGKAVAVATVDAASAQDSVETEALFERAERDYLSIPILKMHLDYLFSQASRAVQSDIIHPEGFSEIYDASAVSDRARAVAEKGARHLSKSHEVWDLWMNWEEERLITLPASTKSSHAETLQQAYIARLATPHTNNDQTFQNYSTFVSTHLGPEMYEECLIEATKVRQDAVSAAAERDAYEASLTSLPAYNAYISWEATPRRGKYQRRQKGRNQPKPQDIPPDPALVVALYERAIAEAALQRDAILSGINGEGALVDEAGLQTADAWLSLFWDGLTSFLREHARNEETELNILARAIRSVPSNGALIASHIRAIDYYHQLDEEPEVKQETLESVMGVYMRGVVLGDMDVSGITAATIARAAYERRRLVVDDELDPEAFDGLVSTLTTAIDLIRANGGDDSLKLEKFLVSTFMELDQFDHQDAAIAVWESASKFYKNKYYVWTEHAAFLTHFGDAQRARKVFKDAATPTRNLDYPQALWTAWIAYEERWGTVEQLEYAIARVRKMTEELGKKAARAAEEAVVAEQQEAMAVVSPSAHVPASGLEAEESSPMAIDERSGNHANGGNKRKAEDAPPVDQPLKKAKPGTDAPLERDRENTTVFVVGLSESSKTEELKALFKDCGEIREVKVTKLQDDTVALIEFIDRDSVPAALTKDKKRLQGLEISVNSAARSTLYITNFPETTDDAEIRKMFGKYGTIFGVRWPAKKFLKSRRFCYLQYTSSESAQAALKLDGRELEPGMVMSVAISDPERKKVRTDANIELREIYVAGLAKSTTQKELETLFADCGAIKGVRVPLDEQGKAKGFGFVEFEKESSATAALFYNNREVKKRRIAVTMIDPRASGRKEQSASGLGKKADLASRSVRVLKLPSGTEEGLLQQAIEKIASGIKRVEIFQDIWEAVVEFETAADAGKLLLSTDGLTFKGVKLGLSEEGMRPVARPVHPSSATAAVPSTSKATPAFVPRTAKPKARVGLGFKGKAPGATSTGNRAPIPRPIAASHLQKPASTKDQDAFRAMLEGKK